MPSCLVEAVVLERQAPKLTSRDWHHHHHEAPGHLPYVFGPNVSVAYAPCRLATGRSAGGGTVKIPRLGAGGTVQRVGQTSTGSLPVQVLGEIVVVMVVVVVGAGN